MTDADHALPTPAEMVARAEAFRARLLAEQAATEARGYYSQELHEAFRDAGFYRLLMPRRYGGLELDLPTFYRVITSIARGCPSTGWMLALGSAHVLQLATSFSERAQDELLEGGHFVASASFGFQDARAEPRRRRLPHQRHLALLLRRPLRDAPHAAGAGRRRRTSASSRSCRGRSFGCSTTGAT